ncbi:MAG: alpha-hydroxy-acid oxidizing protein [Oceanospirillaceae bacterium]|nr:alpha-hydroxy-acid oxidizing protein [Oceanospirillaceae bacterium]
MFNRYEADETYGLHVDNAIRRVTGSSVTVRADLSATLFLSDPEGYDGGELQIEDSFGAQRAGFELPPGVEAVNLKDRPPLPRAVLEPHQSIVFQGMMGEAPRWEDLHWLQRQTELPILVKGIQHPADALRVAEMGLDGVVVSNHGGRGLDCLPSAIEVLPRIRAAVGEDFPLLLDGGIERGTDVYKALALGADAVMVGRPQIWALAVAGALGVAHLLRVLREELEVTMALAGTPTIADITAEALFSGP